jgi:tetratricopeptide (TPR) repeat protein
VKIPDWAIRWWERLCRWAEAGNQLWLKYWVLIAGSLLVAASTVLKWVQSPFSHDYSGIKLSLLHDPGVTPHVSLFSVGVLGLVVLIGALIFLRKSGTLLGLAAAVLMTLWVITPMQIAVRQPSILRRLTYELEVVPVLTVFTKNYLSQNYGSPELVPKKLVLYSAWGRLDAAWSFLRLGWYCFGAGALLIFCHAISRLPSGRLATTVLLLCLPFGAFLIVLTPAAIGQHYYSSAMLARTRGRNQEAISDFRKAMRWDAWHAQDIELYGTIGQLQKQAGIDFESPERHIDRALQLRIANEYEQAIFEFGLVGESGTLAATARKEAALTRITFGLALYQAGGIGGAVNNWEVALAEDPSLIYALPYLARGYYDLGRYREGIAAADRLATLIKDHLFVVANAYSMIGDCYAKLGEDVLARRYYNLSVVADPIMNYWALTGLAGE